MISFRFAHPTDQPRLEEFLAQHWSAQHIFVERPEVFTWQYLQPGSNGAEQRFNMVVAEADGDTCGVLGFIPMGRFSPTLGDRDVMLAVWKVADGSPPGVGLGLLKYLQSQLDPKLVAAIGISAMVRPIYKALRYEVGSMTHWALFNPERRGVTRVASGVPDDAFKCSPSTGSVSIVPISEVGGIAEVVDRLAVGQRPLKDWEYVRRRFIEHPWYDYEVNVAVRSGTPVAVLVWRAVEVHETRILRIVDVIGTTDWFTEARAELVEGLYRRDAEYIDLVEYGIERHQLVRSGFVDTESYSGFVVPNYFSPFEHRNVRIDLAFRAFSGDAPVRLFRADSDQDRPNRSVELAP